VTKTRRTYTREFKLEAVRLWQTSGKSATRIERELGIGGGCRLVNTTLDAHNYHRSTREDSFETLVSVLPTLTSEDVEWVKSKTFNAMQDPHEYHDCSREYAKQIFIIIKNLLD
jgi:hypothetical protein